MLVVPNDLTATVMMTDLLYVCALRHLHTLSIVCSNADSPTRATIPGSSRCSGVRGAHRYCKLLTTRVSRCWAKLGHVGLPLVRATRLQLISFIHAPVCRRQLYTGWGLLEISGGGYFENIWAWVRRHCDRVTCNIDARPGCRPRHQHRGQSDHLQPARHHCDARRLRHLVLQVRMHVSKVM